MTTVIDRLEALAEPSQGTGAGYLREEIKSLWECAECGFVMLADHKDAGTDGYSCPACFECGIRPFLPDLLKLARVAKRLDDGSALRGRLGGDLHDALEPLFREATS